MPVYKGTTLINQIFKGNDAINQAYKGTDLIYTSTSYPYTVNINGPVNTDYGVVMQESGGYVAEYVRLDSTYNRGKTGNAVFLANGMCYTMNAVIYNYNTHGAATMPKDQGQDLVSVGCGYDILNTDTSTFTIASTFYAFDLSDGEVYTNTYNITALRPIQDQSIACGTFTSSGNNYIIRYYSDFRTTGQSIITNFTNNMASSTNHLTYSNFFPMCLGLPLDFYLYSNTPTRFIITYGDMPTERILNNGEIVSGTVQSATNNFNFTIRSCVTSGVEYCANNNGEVFNNVGSFDDVYVLDIASYIAPQYEVSGTLYTEVITATEGWQRHIGD